MGPIFALISIICNSTYAAFGKVLLAYLPPIGLTALAQLISVCALFMVFGVLPECHKFLKFSRKDQAIIGLIAVLTAVIAPILFYYGLNETSAINAVLLTRVEPLVMGLLSIFWLREKNTPDQTFGGILIGLGTIWIITKGFSEGLIFQASDTLIVLSAFFWALANTIFKRHTNHLPVEVVVIARNMIGVIILTLIVPIIFSNAQITPHKAFDTTFWYYMGLFSIVTIILTQSLWYKALKMIPARKASTIGLALPFFGLLWIFLILEETFTEYHIIGGVLIIGGLILSILKEQEHPHHHRHLKAKHWY
ncbi:MAG TPA: DMT family transporter [Candidatus Gracilibacteria bacterium]